MSHQDDPYAPAVHTAHEWLHVVADRIGTQDRSFAHRVLRAWLHTVRDRLSIASAAHLSAQLPELLRGTFYEGWVPGHVPVPHDVMSFIDQFAREAGVSREEAVTLADAVTGALARLFSPGQLDHVLAVLPSRLRAVLLGAGLDDTIGTHPGMHDGEDAQARLQALSEAVAVLARGLEELPGSEYDTTRRISAAQQAHRILLAEGLIVPAARQR
jgi:uncharacterized protein (DUF2267 family)